MSDLDRICETYRGHAKYDHLLQHAFKESKKNDLLETVKALKRAYDEAVADKLPQYVPP